MKTPTMAVAARAARRAAAGAPLEAEAVNNDVKKLATWMLHKGFGIKYSDTTTIEDLIAELEKQIPELLQAAIFVPEARELELQANNAMKILRLKQRNQNE